MRPGECGRRILQEMQDAFVGVDEAEVERLVDEIARPQRVFVYGLGRVLLVMKAFAMRLVHLGLPAAVVGDVTTPAVRAGDLLILGSASGQTQSSLLVASRAKEVGARLGLITASRESRIAALSDFLIVIRAQAKSETGDAAATIQPMASLFEQSMLLIFEVATILLMEKKNVRAPEMLARHWNLE